MAKQKRREDRRAYTVHRGRYGQPPESVCRFESDGKAVRVTFGQLSEPEWAWLHEVIPHMHGTSQWGFAEEYDRPGTGKVGPVRVLVDA